MAAIKTKGPISTAGDAAVVVFTEAEIGGQKPKHISIVNEGAAPGFYSFDGGANFRRIPANTGRQMDGMSIQGDIQIQRVAAGADMTDVFIDIW